MTPPDARRLPPPGRVRLRPPPTEPIAALRPLYEPTCQWKWGERARVQAARAARWAAMDARRAAAGRPPLACGRAEPPSVEPPCLDPTVRLLLETFPGAVVTAVCELA